MKKTLLIGFVVAWSVWAAAQAGAREDRLLEAVRNDDHAAVKALLAHHANPNAALPDKSTALAWAVHRQDEQSVQLLLKAGAKPNALDIDGASPFTLACELGGPAIISDLLKAGGDAKATRPDGISALALCAGISTPEAVDQVIARGADVNAADLKGQTPLMWAAAKGRSDNMAVLIKHGANVNAVTKSGFTALHFALKSKVDAGVTMLADAGADTKVVLPDGTSMVQAAIMEHNIPFALKLVAAMTDMNQRDKRGRQMIHVAASSGSADLVKLVLSKGGDPNAMTPNVKTKPLAVVGPVPTESAAPRTKTIVQVIPASPDCATSALHFAARSGSIPAMNALIDAGAQIGAKDQDGTTLALAAAASGSLETLKYTLGLDSDLNVQTLDGRSILHLVVENPHGRDNQDMIRYLVDKGAKLEVEDVAGHTPGFVVNQRGPQALRVAYIQLLTDRGIVSPFH